MDLDLNQEPLDQTHTSVVEFDSRLDELESRHGHIHDRIRHLEAVTSRARQRLRWPPVHPPIQVTNITGEAATAEARDEGIVESEKGDNKKGVHLIAKALGIETDDVDKEERGTASLFDCNICLDIAREPVLTCCGHLFCWPCFYQLSYAYSKAKECPVCKGEVTETGVIPIYGNSDASINSQLELKQAGLMFPPRPRAPRVDSMRQRLIGLGASPAVIQNIRRINNLIMGGLGEPAQSESPNTASDRNSAGSNQISSFLVEGAASFSPVSSAVNSAVENYIHSSHTGGNRRSNRRAVNGSSTSSGGDRRSSRRAVNASSTSGANVAAGSASSLNQNVGTTAVVGSEIQATDSNVQISPGDLATNSRRTDVSNETRRRRLR